MTRLLVASLCIAHCASALGQPGSSDAPRALTDPGLKTVRMQRTDSAPVIDGFLDEEIWQNAAVVDNLHQLEPVEYAEPFEPTTILLLYDDDALYVGARLHDSSPDEMSALNLRQTDRIGTDDNIFVLLDPFNSRRSAYFFGVNSNSVRHDGLFRNATDPYSEWDGIYRAQASRFEDGWIAEFEIPFNTISFDQTTDTWGMNFVRNMPRLNSRSAWMSRNRQFGPSTFGLATGFEGLQQGIGLDVVPSVISRRNKSFDSGDTTSDFEPSVDVAYRLTPSLNASLTFNTDFSATEVDDRQVNLTRFGLFFPEKRDFFLRESDIFEFGNIGVPNGTVYAFDRGGQNGRPFFSRRIGLSPTGQPIDLEHGAKLSGRVGAWELGLLSVRQDEFANTDADTVSVARVKLGVLRESSVGLIATEGDPGSSLDNSLTGFDFLYRNSRMPGGRRLETELWYQSSETQGRVGDDSAYGVGIRVPSAEGIRGGAQFRRYERNFNPALGFLNRPGVTDTTFDVGYTFWPRETPLQSLLITLDGRRINRIDGGLQSQALNFRPVDLTTRSGDGFRTINRVYKETLLKPFEISPGIVIPRGAYGFRDAGFQIDTADYRKVSGTLRYVDGSFYDGNLTEVLSSLIWVPSARFRASLSYHYNDVTLSQGSFETRLVSAGIDYVFSSTLSWVNLIQYDNVTETIGANMRLHWIPEAGRELYLVINHNLQDRFDRDNTFESERADISLKYTHTFRF